MPVQLFNLKTYVPVGLLYYYDYLLYFLQRVQPDVQIYSIWMLFPCKV